MKQERFTQRNETSWRELETLLGKASPDEGWAAGHLSDDMAKAESGESTDFPRVYRRVCQHLALARSRLYSGRLIDRLNVLVLLGHQRLYSHGDKRRNRVRNFFVEVFPGAVRAESRLVWLSALVFYLPLLAMLLAIQLEPDMAYMVMDAGTLGYIEEMYEPSGDRIGIERGAESDMLAFAYYIHNNTGIGFRTFASGLLLGLGTLATLLFNGLFIGTVAGHLTRIGYNETFWSFVSGHSALELTAIVLSGAAGLRLGLAILAPGRRSRRDALRWAAGRSVPVISGAAVMFFLAAFVEAFWSSMAFIPPTVKYGVGLGMWVLVLAYFIFQGRRDGA